MPVIEYEKPTKASPFKSLVDSELTAVRDALVGNDKTPANPKAATEFSVSTLDAGRVKSLMSETARKDFGMTARFLLIENDGKTVVNKETKETEPSPDSKTRFIVTLGKLQKARHTGPRNTQDSATDAEL